MELEEYKKYLNSNRIKLFDYQYRLSLYKLNLVYSLNKDQVGGGKNILYNKNSQTVKKIVDCSLSNNVKLGYIYQLIYS